MRKINSIAAALLMLAAPATVSAQTDDWAGNGRYAGSNAQLTARPKAVFFGDSITDNWGNWTHPEFFPEHNFVARGFSGQTTFQMLIRFRYDVINLHPKYAVILAGTNDLAENLGPVCNEVILGNIISMCELAKANGIKPVICSLLPAYRYGWRPEIDAAGRIEAFNVLLEEYARKARIKYVDYYNALKDERGGLPDVLAPDGVHPNLEGYLRMEAIVLPYLR